MSAFKPALNWIQRWLPLFFVPTLVVLPIALQAVAPEDAAKVGGLVLLGMPLTLYVTAGLVAVIRSLTCVKLLPVPPGAALPPFRAAHGAAWAALAALGLAGAVADDALLTGVASAFGSPAMQALTAVGAVEGGTAVSAADIRTAAKSLFLLAGTVGGLLVGSGVCPPALAKVLPHPVVVTALAGNGACAALGAVTGDGYWQTLQAYLTKGKVGAAPGAGDALMGFLGCVVLSFGFHIYGQRALLFRHAAEVVGCAAGSALLSLAGTCVAGRLMGLPPDLSLAVAPRSVTVALAMPIAEQLSVPPELIPVCATAVVLTGLLGAASCQRLMDVARIADPVTRGLATAGSSHGLGTAALAAKEPAALPFAALAYGMMGVAASCWAAIPPVREALQALAGKTIVPTATAGES